MTRFSIEVYHNDEARFMPYENGQRLTLVITHHLDLPHTTPEDVAGVVYHIFNADLHLLETGREDDGGETLFLAAYVYRFLRLRSLSVGDVVHITGGTTPRWLACEPIGWKTIDTPSNLDGMPLNANKVYLNLRTSRDER
jgi:hypothetical protein